MIKENIINGCEFQSDCIEYKDISYLKIMPICAIHELSIACHDKVNKCKYYKLYKQLKRLEQENEKLKEVTNEAKIEHENLLINRNDFAERVEKYRQALEEIRKQYVNKAFFKCDKTEEECPCHNCIILGQLDRVQNIIKIIDEVLNDRN